MGRRRRGSENLNAEPVYETLAAWFINGRSGLGVSKEVIAVKLKSIREEAGAAGVVIRESQVATAIAEVRRILEARHALTLYRVAAARGESRWKVASPAELADYTAKWVKRTVLYADRTYRLVDAVKGRKCERLLQDALRETFSDTSGKIKAVSETGRRYLRVVADLTRNKIGLIEEVHDGKA